MSAEYSIIQYFPNTTRGEGVNVGVIRIEFDRLGGWRWLPIAESYRRIREITRQPADRVSRRLLASVIKSFGSRFVDIYFRENSRSLLVQFIETRANAIRMTSLRATKETLEELYEALVK